MIKYLRLIAELGKMKITFAVSLTTIAGYVLANDGFDTGLILPTLGIFLLACGSSALNHYQERDKDAMMERTKDRPIPSGKISPSGAMIIAILFIVSGAYLLYFGSGFLAMQLGLLALIWYNAIYTPLKRKTAFAVVPGSIIGAIPPVVGWVAAGGSLTNPQVLILAFFFFIWQVPHFWLLLLKYGKEYEQAGFPSLTSIYTENQIRNITFIWTLATAIASLMIATFGVIDSIITKILLLLAAIWLVIAFADLILRKNQAFNPFKYFMKINYFVLMVLFLLTLDVYL
ncbi:MAG: heme o synthase [Bacteroidales bacterium]|nr:heme o synthase [Bacteroidales bacterium]MCF8386831.1 heme o synthase [Bacteroidales bacterium]MCF8398666.1 heme o synthase [Bacteroidales bacterium]